jgi:tetratricopeptide (TPR) repeat protein
LPALLFLGLVAGGAGRFNRLDSPAPRSRSAWRLPALATLTLWLSLVGLSAELPERAESDANSALVQAANSTVGALAAAQSSAVEAARLDPLSDAGPLAEETIALHRGRVVQARRYVQEALSRNPSDQRAWAALVFVDTLLGERSEAAAAVQRIADLDPLGGLARFELASQLLSAPPGDSATSVRTPGSHS